MDENLPTETPQTAKESAVVFEGGPDMTIQASLQKNMAEQLADFQSGRTTSTSQTQEGSVNNSNSETVKSEDPTIVYVGSKKYTVEELALKAQKLEELEQKERAKIQAEPIEEDISELMFTDPKTYTQKLKESAKREMKQEEDFRKKSAETAKQVKERFYTQNKDLRAHEDLVEAFALKLRPQLANEPDEVALSKLAQAVRAKVASIQGSQGTVEELSSRPAVTLGATGNPSTRAPSTSKAPTDFVSQMRQAFKKGSPKY